MSEFLPREDNPLFESHNTLGEFYNRSIIDFYEWSQAQRWIDQNCVYEGNKLDILATAEKIGIPVIFEMPPDIDGRPSVAYGKTTGLLNPGEAISILLNPRNRDNAQPITYGHELGHYFFEKVAQLPHPLGYSERIEGYCEFFGRQVAVPVTALEHIDKVTPEIVQELMDELNASHMDIFYQLMMMGKVPRQIVFDSGIGDVPNPQYSGKVSRHVICLDCELGVIHGTNTMAEFPVYDFTNSELSNYTSTNSCTPFDEYKSFEFHKALNRRYGRWGEADDLWTTEAIDEEVRRKRLARTAIDNT